MKRVPSEITPKKTVFYSICMVIAVLLLAEIASRVFLAIRMDAPFFMPGRIIYNYYPELKAVKESVIDKEDGYFDILFLDGSALNNRWGNIEELLLDELESRTNRKVRIYNLSMPAHTSLDSYYKYKYLDDKQFDLVLFYHGINELRINNCPPSLFRSDYSHYCWYEDVNILEAHKEINFTTLPYALHYLAIKIRQRYTHLPMSDEPIAEWLRYGCEIKSASCFRKNLTGILETALKKRETVLLMTYAFFVPEDYSLEKFQNKSLDYVGYKNPIEIWGEPDNVVKGINVHNEIIRDISGRYKNVIFVDQDGLIPKDGSYFDDICHFSEKGCKRFVGNISGLIVEKEKQK